MKSRRKGLLYVVIFLLILVALFYVELEAKVFRKWYVDTVGDGKNHFLSCNKLPQVSKVKEVVEMHQETIHKIKQVNPGWVKVRIDTLTCPGKADILIEYPTHQDRIAIENIISDERFFGIPYRLRNY